MPYLKRGEGNNARYKKGGLAEARAAALKNAGKRMPPCPDWVPPLGAAAADATDENNAPWQRPNFPDVQWACLPGQMHDEPLVPRQHKPREEQQRELSEFEAIEQQLASESTHDEGPEMALLALQDASTADSPDRIATEGSEGIRYAQQPEALWPHAGESAQESEQKVGSASPADGASHAGEGDDCASLDSIQDDTWLGSPNISLVATPGSAGWVEAGLGEVGFGDSHGDSLPDASRGDSSMGGAVPAPFAPLAPLMSWGSEPPRDSGSLLCRSQEAMKEAIGHGERFAALEEAEEGGGFEEEGGGVEGQGAGFGEESVRVEEEEAGCLEEEDAGGEEESEQEAIYEAEVDVVDGAVDGAVDGGAVATTVSTSFEVATSRPHARLVIRWL